MINQDLRTLNSSILIGEVGALYLETYTKDYNSEQGTLRFILNQVKAEHAAAITRSILAKPELAQMVEIHLPKHFVQGYELPETVLTDKRATYFRNIEVDKPILLLANTGDDEEQSMKLIMPIGNQELLLHPGIWLEVVARGLSLSEQNLQYWEKALKGLIELNRHSFDRIVSYLIDVREQIEIEGLPLIKALGAALPALMLPKDTEYFEGMSEKLRHRPSAWKKQIENADRQRASYLRKQTPSQTTLSESELRASFKNIRESIREDLLPYIEAFIEAPEGWNSQAAALARCEWEEIQPLFSGLKKEKVNLAKETQDFFDNSNPDLLNADDLDYLKRLAKRRTGIPDEEDKSFYDTHGQEFKQDRKLKSTWDKFIHGSPIERENFLEGLMLCFERLLNTGATGQKHLRISLDRNSKNDLREINAEAGTYFAFRYKGIKELLGNNVNWEVGQLFDFTKLFSERYPRKYSVAKTALQLKFTLELSSKALTGAEYRHATQLIWKYNSNTVVTEMAEDWSRLADHPFVYCNAARETLSSKGSFQSVDLSNVKTFIPTYDKDRGSFVPAYKPKNDIAKNWVLNFKEACKSGLINTSVEEVILEKWNQFQTYYTQAISDFLDQGIVSSALFKQAQAYEVLLSTICTLAKGDKNRALVLKPILAIGSIRVEGAMATEIIAPWHPLRLLAIGVKSCRVGGYIKHFLEAPEIQFGDAGRLFFKDIQEELQHPFYPEVVIGWRENKPELLSLSDVCGDYSLHEMSNNGIKGLQETNDNPGEGASCVVDLVNRYVSLQPHEKANLSVVLYNCDSARLPQAVVDKIGGLREDEEDFHCHVVLKHRDDQKLRQLYERIIEFSDTDPDAYSASEATRDFMARLRIGISADQTTAPFNEDGPPNDIVFSQDVIARHAHIEWFWEEAHPIELAKLVPVRWSRRRPAAFDDMKSVVYLCCPAHTKEGWGYLTAITTFFKGDWDGNEHRRLLPARQLDFNEPEMSRIFKETHYLGNWVVNYDELLDRRQLMNQGVRVIRYKQVSTQGRNLVVSSNAPLNLLRSMILSRIQNLNLGLDVAGEFGLADKFIQQANDISGDIVLRAAKRGRNASELMGVVLSRYLITKEIQNRLGSHCVIGWYFLDDYATWLGQREEQIADILMLCPSASKKGDLQLDVIVTEAKFVDFSSYPAGAKNSRNQLRDTVRRLQDALFGDPLRIDRELWLGRLADLILDGVQFSASANLNLSNWRRAIRDGTCKFCIRGYSHVFISGPANAPSVDDFTPIADMKEGYQEIYGYAQVQNLVQKYFRDEDPTYERINRHGWDLSTMSLYQPSVGAIQLPHACASLKSDFHAESSTKDQDDDQKNGDKPLSAVGNGSIDPGEIEANEGAFLNLLSSDSDKSRQKAEPPAIHGGSIQREDFSFFGEHTGIDEIIQKQFLAKNAIQEEEQWLKLIVSRTKEALQGLNFQAKLISSQLTPNAALLKFQGSANLTLDQVLRKQIEFKTTYGLSLISVQPEPGLLALAIERPQRQVVKLEEVWRQWQGMGKEGLVGLPIAIREDNGKILFLSPQKNHAPHTLIAGSTGSGKSVLMQNIILSIAASHTPAEARIILIDPKLGVDYFGLEELPHLKPGIIDDQGEALEQLKFLVEEMDKRYRQFKEVKVSNLTAFNKKVDPERKMPLLWLIHDEFAEWMLVEEYKKEVTAFVGRLGVKARAAGIYLVFAAQRPDANVVPMQLRANLGNRLILRVDSEGTSEIALGMKGAERLLGKGHILVKVEGESQLLFGQVPYISEETMRLLVKAIQE